MGSMQEWKPSPQPTASRSKTESSSPNVGSRQSHCPAKQGPPLFSECGLPDKQSVTAVPSAAVPDALHVYLLSASCGLPKVMVPSRLSFFSHWRPVELSVTVPSPLSRNRAASHVDPVPLALVCNFAQALANLTEHFYRSAKLKKRPLTKFHIAFW